MNAFDQYESNVRSYCRKFPATFDKAYGSILHSTEGKEYIDFFDGAGALNYGHNNPYIMNKVIEYISSQGIVHALDMHTKAKEEFIETFQNEILKPRGLNYKIQFCGPTGTNASESAMKLARKATGRRNVFAFMGGYHGMTNGALAATGNLSDRACTSSLLNGVVFFPYPCGPCESIDTIAYMDAVLSDDHSGIEKPAAVIYETVQAEGGVNRAPDFQWYRRLRELCDKHSILLICDDIQVGCFRTGKFFSFEHAGIIPDMVVLSKSISGCGFPMSIVLMKPELDVWEPGEHTGTFRGYQPAFVGARAAIEFGKQVDMEKVIAPKAEYMESFLKEKVLPLLPGAKLRGLGMIWGVDFTDVDGITAADVSNRCYQNGLVIELAGRHGNVLKLIPSLVIEQELLEKGCEIILKSITELLK